MKYPFPYIKNISDILPAIQDAPEFAVTVKDGYTVINYHVSTPTTFPEVVPPTKDEVITLNTLREIPAALLTVASDFNTHAALRRECRGIIFCNETGEILSRPYHKFFNVNEKPETQENLLDLSLPHVVPHKLDGSMIRAFKVKGKVIWGTKMGDTDVAKPINDFVKANPNYERFAQECLVESITPIFEWCSRKQRIVLDHPEDKLVLTALRYMRSGQYEDYQVMCKMAEKDNIPVVEVIDPQSDMRKFIEHVEKLEDVEGFVVRFADGHMVKLKCDWYCAIHRAKDRIMFDRHVVGMILDEKLDDLIPHLLEEDRVKLREFEGEFLKLLEKHTNKIYEYVTDTKAANPIRKDFAFAVKSLEKDFKTLVFLAFDNVDRTHIRECLITFVRKYLVANVDWEFLRDKWFEGIKYNR